MKNLLKRFKLAWYVFWNFSTPILPGKASYTFRSGAGFTKKQALFTPTGQPNEYYKEIQKKALRELIQHLDNNHVIRYHLAKEQLFASVDVLAPAMKMPEKKAESIYSSSISAK